MIRTRYGTYGGNDFGQTTESHLVDALRASPDARHLVIDGHVVFNNPVLLHEFVNSPGAGGWLSLVGNGRGKTVLFKNFMGAPLLRSENEEFWHLEWYGLEWSDEARWGDQCPLADFPVVDRSYIERCATTGGWSGLRFGYRPYGDTRFAQCGGTSLVDNQIMFGIRAGIELHNATCVQVRGGFVERNGRDLPLPAPGQLGASCYSGQGYTAPGILFRGPPPGHPSYPTRGKSTISGVHFELAGANGYWAIDIERARRVRIIDNDFTLARVRLAGDAFDCVVRGNDHDLPVADWLYNEAGSANATDSNHQW